MEQVLLDRAIYSGDFLEEFATMENKLSMVNVCNFSKLVDCCSNHVNVLVQVLCSLQMALMEKQIQPDADAARQMMTNEYRDMKSESGRNLRDFIILRDYINLLEYLVQVLQHFQGSSWRMCSSSSCSSLVQTQVDNFLSSLIYFFLWCFFVIAVVYLWLLRLVWRSPKQGTEQGNYVSGCVVNWLGKFPSSLIWTLTVIFNLIICTIYVLRLSDRLHCRRFNVSEKKIQKKN